MEQDHAPARFVITMQTHKVKLAVQLVIMTSMVVVATNRTLAAAAGRQCNTCTQPSALSTTVVRLWHACQQAGVWHCMTEGLSRLNIARIQGSRAEEADEQLRAGIAEVPFSRTANEILLMTRL